MLVGKRLYLRLIEERDIPHKVRWINDPEVRATLNFDYPISEVGTRQWLYKIASDRSRREFIICLKDCDEQIGYAGLLDIDRRNSKAELYMGIGERDHWGKGYATEARELQLQYGFVELGLNRLYAFNWVHNEKVLALNKKFGFRVEGTLRQDVFSHGEFRDRLIMGLLKTDYLRLRNR